MTRYAPSKRGLSTISICLGIAAGLVGSTDAAKQQDSRSTGGAIPVEWTPALSMPSLLSEGTAANTQEDLIKLLSKRWYASIDVETGKEDESRTLNNCDDLFAASGAGLHAQQASENGALLEFKVMCEATRLLGQATPARHSNTPASPLDATLPARLPKSFALITSQSEWQRIQQDPTLAHWEDVSPIGKAEQKAPHQTTYYADGGVQTLSILGRGDLNGDGWNDILVTVKDAVEGGSYFNLRLFVLTVTAQDQWQVVVEY